FGWALPVCPVKPSELAAFGDVVEDLTVAVSALRHENTEDVKVLGLEEALGWEKRLRNAKVAPTDCGILGTREHFVERRKKARRIEDAHDRFHDICDQLFVGVNKIAW